MDIHLLNNASDSQAASINPVWQQGENTAVIPAMPPPEMAQADEQFVQTEHDGKQGTPSIDAQRSKKGTKKRKPNADAYGTPLSSTSKTPQGTLSRSFYEPTTSRRQLEYEAYAAIVTAFKAQGELTWKKENILTDLRAVLRISDERHRTEMKRAEETLSGVPPSRQKKAVEDAYAYSEGEEVSSEWDSDDEDSKRKKRKVPEEKDTYYGALPFPSSGEQTAYLYKLPAKKVQKQKKKPSSTKKKPPPAPSYAPGELPSNFPTSAEIEDAKQTGDTEKLRAALTQQRDRIKAELEALNMAQQ